jgi:transposase InsO family protein
MSQKKSLDLAALGPEARRQVVLTLSAEYPQRLICRATDWPRSSVHHHTAPAVDEGRLRRTLRRLAALWPTYGYRRLTAMLRREGWPVNGKRVRRLMAELGIKGNSPVRRRRTTDSRHDFPRYLNLVGGLQVTHTDQLWVADITYVRLQDDFVYLAVIVDVFTRRVWGWELGRSLDQGLTLAALKRAMGTGRRPKVHDSDQGVQYAATAYTDLLADCGVAISTATVGKPKENEYAERQMRAIRAEEIDPTKYRDFADAYGQLGRFLDEVYNRRRIHSALGDLTPREFEQRWLRGLKATAVH